MGSDLPFSLAALLLGDVLAGGVLPGDEDEDDSSSGVPTPDGGPFDASEAVLAPSAADFAAAF